MTGMSIKVVPQAFSQKKLKYQSLQMAKYSFGSVTIKLFLTLTGLIQALLSSH